MVWVLIHPSYSLPFTSLPVNTALIHFCVRDYFRLMQDTIKVDQEEVELLVK